MVRDRDIDFSDSEWALKVQHRRQREHWRNALRSPIARPFMEKILEAAGISCVGRKPGRIVATIMNWKWPDVTQGLNLYNALDRIATGYELGAKKAYRIKERADARGENNNGEDVIKCVIIAHLYAIPVTRVQRYFYTLSTDEERMDFYQKMAVERLDHRSDQIIMPEFGKVE